MLHRSPTKKSASAADERQFEKLKDVCFSSGLSATSQIATYFSTRIKAPVVALIAIVNFAASREVP